MKTEDRKICIIYFIIYLIEIKKVSLNLTAQKCTAGERYKYENYMTISLLLWKSSYKSIKLLLPIFSNFSFHDYMYK